MEESFEEHDRRFPKQDQRCENLKQPFERRDTMSCDMKEDRISEIQTEGLPRAGAS